MHKNAMSFQNSVPPINLVLLHSLNFCKMLLCVQQDDGYVPDHSVLKLQKAWPGSEVRWVRGGHVSSFILHNKTFQKAIIDGLDRLD